MNKDVNPQPYDITRDVASLQKRVEALERVQRQSAWFDFVPTWTATTTPPVLGAGTLQGQYMRAGSMIVYSVYFVAAADTTFGVGTFFWDLPFPFDSTHGSKAGSALAKDAAPQKNHFGQCVVETTGLLAAYLIPGTAASTIRADASTPFAWAVGDSLTMTVIYPTTD